MSAAEAKPLVDADARARIRGDLDTTLIVEAAAGTGKTTELVARVLSLVTSGRATLSRIVAVTFTEKAAGEMKLRLRGEIERARPDAGPDERRRLDGALAELEAAHISTIHGFCAELLRERPVEARVDPLFEMAAEDEQERLYDEAFETWFEDVLRDPPEGVRRVLRRSQGRDGRGPRDELRRAGLDRVRQRDFDGAWRREPFAREEAIDDVMRRLASAAAFADKAGRDDDYLAKHLAILARFVDDVSRRESVRRESSPNDPRDYDRLEAELRSLAGYRTKWTWKGGGSSYARGISRVEVLRVRDDAKRALDAMLTRSGADLAACLHRELTPLVSAYETLKAAGGKLDFIDLLAKTRDLLQGDQAVRAELQGRFSHLLVDEFQDTDPLQAEILVLLAAADPAETDPLRARTVPGKLFLVGDPKQAIYRFRRADVALYEAVKRRLLARGAEVLHLSTSFRSTPAIQGIINAAFAPLMRGGEDGSQAEYVALQPFRPEPSGRPSVIALPVPRPYADYGKITKWRIDESIPDAVGAFVQHLLAKSGWTIEERERRGERIPLEARHVCLLFKRFQSFGEDVTRPYVRALEARGIPHVLVGGRSYHSREEVHAIRNALAAIEWPDDELSVYATLRGPLFALGDDALLSFRAATKGIHPMGPRDPATLSPACREVAVALDLLRALHDRRNRRPIEGTLSELLGATRAHAGFAIWPGGEQALANLLRMTDLARRFESAGATSFRAFVERVSEDADRRGAGEAPVVEEGTDGVRMMTVHKSKGLEFPVVILVDPTAPLSSDRPSRWVDPERRIWAMPLAGVSPIELVENEEEVRKRDRDESVRLTYVAATRARELLVVPVLGDTPDEALDSWLSVLSPAVHPAPADRRAPGVAEGCPPFGDDSVVDRPSEARSTIHGAVAPGAHRGSVGGVDVVWWDPSALALGREHESGLRQEKLLAADESSAVAEEGARAHTAWQERRSSLLSAGSRPSTRVEIATAVTTAPLSRAITYEEVEGRGDARPRGKRYGTLVHAVLAEVDLDADRIAVERVATKQARLISAPENERASAVDTVLAALAHPLLRQAAQAGKRGDLRREVPVVLPLEDRVLEGVVDLAFREDGAWVVVDYKTDAAAYDIQMNVYVAGIERATGEKARGVLLRV